MCTPGQYQYFRRGRHVCYRCGPGQFQPEAGKTECLPCPDGAVANGNGTACMGCPAGQVVTEEGCACPDGGVLTADGGCGTCAAGKERDGGICTRCRFGFFKMTEGGHPCVPCGANMFALRGATTCTECPEGKALMNNGECGSCAPGQYLEKAIAKVCRECGRNEIQAHENVAGRCFACAGDATSGRGATECTKCPFGEALMRDGRCGVCAPGTGYDEYRLRCARCGVNSYSAGRGAEQRCEHCPTLSYALPGSKTCLACGFGRALVVKKGKGECVMCPAGTYYDEYEGKCVGCEEDEVSRGGVVGRCRFCGEGSEPNAEKSTCVV